MIKSINIITSPFCCIPPHAIGAVEKRWKSCGDMYRSMGIDVKFICKKPTIEEKVEGCIYIKGYGRTGSKLKDLFLDLVYSFKALRHSPKADAIILNTIWSPILLPLFKHKFKVSLYNVARFPKHQLGLYRSVDVLSCVSTAVYNCLVRQTPTMKHKACVISNFIDTKTFSRRRTHVLPECPIVVYSGRVHREKGLEMLVNAINNIHKTNNISLKIIGAWDIEHGGSGIEYKTELSALADGWDINWVAPIYSPALLAEELDKCDIFCYPSIAEKGETFGVAPLEAMGLGIPTIVSNLDCFKDFIVNGENGLIFNHRSSAAIDELTEKIRLLINNKELYGLISEKSASSSRSFSIDNKAMDYLQLLDNLLLHHCIGFDEKTMKIVKL